MPENPSEAEKAQALEREGERLLKQVKNGFALVLLDVAGKNLSSEELARFMADLSVQGQSDIIFIIGFPPPCRKPPLCACPSPV